MRSISGVEGLYSVGLRRSHSVILYADSVQEFPKIVALFFAFTQRSSINAFNELYILLLIWAHPEGCASLVYLYFTFADQS